MRGIQTHIFFFFFLLLFLGFFHIRTHPCGPPFCLLPFASLPLYLFTSLPLYLFSLTYAVFSAKKMYSVRFAEHTLPIKVSLSSPLIFFFPMRG